MLNTIIVVSVTDSLEELVLTSMVETEMDGVLQKLIDDVMNKKKQVLQTKMTPEGKLYNVIEIILYSYIYICV